MNGIRRFLVFCLGMGVSTVVSLLVMIKGWGVHPQSWGWILGVGIFGQIAAYVIMSIGTIKD